MTSKQIRQFTNFIVEIIRFIDYNKLKRKFEIFIEIKNLKQITKKKLHITINMVVL